MSWSGASTSSSLRQPPLRPLGRWCTPRFKNLKHETQKQEYFTITQVPLPCVPLLPSDISIWNLGSPARHQRGHWEQQRWQQGGVQRKRGPCEVPSTSSLQRLLLSRVLCQVITMITIIKITSTYDDDDHDHQNIFYDHGDYNNYDDSYCLVCCVRWIMCCTCS